MFALLLSVSLAMSNAANPDEGAAAAPEETSQVRTARFVPGTAAEALAWQASLRSRFARLLAVDDWLEGPRPPLGVQVLEETVADGYVRRDLEFQTTSARRAGAIVTVPATGEGPYPAVVCIHGHSSSRGHLYDADAASHAWAYKEFARELAGRGFVTIAVDVGQHEVYERGRTLMGERLWDLMRAVDLLAGMPEVDAARIGCAGLSLGGEMAMWLGAMDTRAAAVVSSGFLTVMDQMEQNHCMCWKFDGLRELADFADVYALIAPRPLQCQNGRKEPETAFTVELAKRAFAEIQPAYVSFDAVDRLELCVHDGGHEVELPVLLEFLSHHLGAAPD